MTAQEVKASSTLENQLTEVMADYRAGKKNWEETCEDIIDLVHSPIGGFLRKVGHRVDNEETIKDLFQEFSLALWRRGRKYDAERGGVMPFLFTIARSVKRDYFRLQRNRQENNQILLDHVDRSDLEQEVSEKVTLQDLYARVYAECSEEDQTIFFLHYRSEMKTKDIAAVVDLTASTVEKRLQRLRARFVGGTLKTPGVGESS
jgi:RNA polymerase sigma factor (sigma-70 family)